MLFTFLEHIRQKPKSVRDQYALGIAVMCTILITGVWSLSLPARFAATSSASLASASSTAPFAGLFTQLRNQFKGVKESMAVSEVSSTTSPTVASSTQAALDLQLSEENMTALDSPTTTVQFASTTFGAVPVAAVPDAPLILIATSSTTTNPAQ